MRIHTNHLLIIAWLLMALMGKARSQDLVYTVKAPNANYMITPSDPYLFAGCHNKIKIVHVGPHIKFNASISNGKLQRVNDSIFVISDVYPLVPNIVLSLSETNKQGKTKIVHTKHLKVIPYPVIECGGVKSDSAINKYLLMGATVEARYKGRLNRAKVTKFKMDILDNGKFITDSASNGHFTKKMRAYIDQFKKGGLITLKDITYVNSAYDTLKEPIYRVFIYDDPNPTQFEF